MQADDNYVETDYNSTDVPDGYSSYQVITNQNAEFQQDKFAVFTDMGWIAATEYERLKLTNGQRFVSSPLGSRKFAIVSLTDPTKDIEQKATFVIFQDDKPSCQFDFKGSREFNADWIDETLLKIVSWPGTHARETTLINVQTGKVIYRAADVFFDS